jgi:hypothetical protein
MRKMAQMSPMLSQVPPTLWIGLAGVAMVWLGGQLGGWWVTFLVGLAIGMALPRRALALAGAVGALGWGLPLALLALSAPVGGVAGAVAGLVGLPAAIGALVVILATLLVGCLLSVVGAWVGLTGRRLLPADVIEMPVRALQERVLARVTRSRTG